MTILITKSSYYQCITDFLATSQLQCCHKNQHPQLLYLFCSCSCRSLAYSTHHAVFNIRVRTNLTLDGYYGAFYDPRQV